VAAAGEVGPEEDGPEEVGPRGVPMDGGSAGIGAGYVAGGWRRRREGSAAGGAFGRFAGARGGGEAAERIDWRRRGGSRRWWAKFLGLTPQAIGKAAGS